MWGFFSSIVYFFENESIIIVKPERLTMITFLLIIWYLLLTGGFCYFGVVAFFASLWHEKKAAERLFGYACLCLMAGIGTIITVSYLR